MRFTNPRPKIKRMRKSVAPIPAAQSKGVKKVQKVFIWISLSTFQTFPVKKSGQNFTSFMSLVDRPLLWNPAATKMLGSKITDDWLMICRPSELVPLFT